MFFSNVRSVHPDDNDSVVFLDVFSRFPFCPHVHPVNFPVPLHLQGLREVFVGIIQMVDDHFLVVIFFERREQKNGKTFCKNVENVPSLRMAKRNRT